MLSYNAIFLFSYNTYSADISFSDSLARGLVSVQVSVQSEVAASKTKAKEITDKIKEIEDKITVAVEKVWNINTYGTIRILMIASKTEVTANSYSEPTVTAFLFAVQACRAPLLLRQFV